jgi:hypothetical protein
VPDEAEAVSYNHFDQDGLVSIYALVASVQRRTFLEDVAFAVRGLLTRLHVGDGQESSIAPDGFVELLTDHLRTAPPAWDPFAPKS